MRQIQQYQAEDGKVFDTEAACVEHENSLARFKDLVEYSKALAEAGINGAANTRRVAAAKLYIEWLEEGKIKPLQKPKAEAA